MPQRDSNPRSQAALDRAATGIGSAYYFFVLLIRSFVYFVSVSRSLQDLSSGDISGSLGDKNEDGCLVGRCHLICVCFICSFIHFAFFPVKVAATPKTTRAASNCEFAEGRWPGDVTGNCHRHYCNGNKRQAWPSLNDVVVTHSLLSMLQL
jgi:hypothetical protein